jgi:hypothetical protein
MKCLIILALILAPYSSVEACQSVSTDRQQQLERAIEKLDAEDIGKIRVFFVPYDRIAPIPVDQRALEDKWEIRVDPTKMEQYVESLRLTVRKTRFCMHTCKADLHWGVIILNKEGENIFSLSIDRKYFLLGDVRAEIEGLSFVTSASIASWFENNFWQNDGLVSYIKPRRKRNLPQQ